MVVSTKYRTDKHEAMDDFAMEGEILQDALDKIASINKLLGGNNLTIEGLSELLSNVSPSDEIVILDVGCGNGDMLRTVADYGMKHNLKFKLIGIDANLFTVEYARQLSSNYPNISYNCEDVFDESFIQLKYDIVLCTLTLHHFKDDEIVKLLSVFNGNSKIGIIINDLQRSIVSYGLFHSLCFVFRLNDMSREDGLISILRGFKRNELIAFSKKANLKKYTIRWKWAFRYQWIIKK